MKGQIWISAVLYMALGIIVIALVLSASIPVVEKLNDRSTVAETKEILLTLDETIRIVSREGPGSQREIPSLTLSEGKLFIDDEIDKIWWEMKTSAVLLEPDTPLKEGILSLELKTTPVKEEYLVIIGIDYKGKVDLLLDSAYPSPFFGKYQMIVSHKGEYTQVEGETVPVVAVRII